MRQSRVSSCRATPGPILLTIETVCVPSPEDFVETLTTLAQRCPRLLRSCYWAGTSPIILEETHHRQSYDIDLHTLRALRDVRPFGVELRNAFGTAYQVLSEPDSLGSGFRGSLDLASGGQIFIEVMASFESPGKADLVPSKLVPGWRRVSLRRYTLDMLQCVAERMEARDLVDLRVVFDYRKELAEACRRQLSNLDQLLLGERLLSWTDETLRSDLEAYPGVDWKLGAGARDTLLGWLQE
jgi:hypothetical protein